DPMLLPTTKAQPDAGAFSSCLHFRFLSFLERPTTGSKAGRQIMAKYGRAAAAKVKRAMHERKHGTLKSGLSGRKVTSRKQAIAIGLAEARRAGAKVPRKSK